MLNEWVFWGGIAMAAGATLVTRVSGPLIVRRFALTPRLRRFLEAAGISVLAAIVASEIAASGADAAAAATTAAICMALFRRAWLGMIGAMVVAAGLHALR